MRALVGLEIGVDVPLPELVPNLKGCVIPIPGVGGGRAQSAEDLALGAGEGSSCFKLSPTGTISTGS